VYERCPALGHESGEIKEVLRLALEGIDGDGWIANTILVVEHECYFLEVRDTAVDVVAGRLRIEACSVEVEVSKRSGRDLFR